MADDVSLLTSDTEKANAWFNNEETFRDVYSKKSPEWLDIVAKNMTPIWDSGLSKYVAEEEKEETETASLEDEINLLKNDVVTNTLENDGDGVDTTTLETNDDELPF